MLMSGDREKELSGADFSGSFPYHVDDKGRTKLPASFVPSLGNPFIATRGLDGCIWLLPKGEWEALSAPLRRGGFGNRGL